MKLLGKTVTLTTVLIIVGLTLILGVVAYAAYSYSQTVNWTYQDQTESFWVENTDPINYGVLTSESTFTRTYQVVNDGNVPITVIASTTGTGFTASWDKTTATIQPQEAATFTLTLTITGQGSCTVSINGT